jgi:hypothetical protein
MATTGIASVSQLSPDGAILVRYHDGKADWRRIHPDNMPKDAKKAFNHLNQPARYVETSRGSTLTFPDGETINYRKMILD